jgi:hypothetical protein
LLLGVIATFIAASAAAAWAQASRDVADAQCAGLITPFERGQSESAGTDGRRKRALLVGISRYARGHGEPRDWWDIPTGCDVALMKTVLISRFGFPERDVATLTEDQATLGRILAKFQEHLIDRAAPGDVIVFYFSGHGQPIPDPEDRTLDGQRASLVTWDYIDQRARNGALTNLRSDTLRDKIRGLRQRMERGGQVVGDIAIFLDACYSGGGTKAPVRSKGRGWDTEIDGPLPAVPGGSKGITRFAFEPELSLAKGHVLITACGYDDVAIPKSGTGASLFTYHLANELVRATPETTYEALFDRLVSRMAGLQRPQLEGEYSKRLFGGEAVPGEAYVRVEGVAGDTVILAIGAIQGTTEGSRFSLFRAGSSIRDERNRVAEVEVFDVMTTTCRARLTRESALAVNRDDLISARAVETVHNYAGHRLRAFFDGVTPPRDLVQLEMITTRGAGPRDNDVSIRRDGDRVRVVLPSGVVIADLRDDCAGPVRLREALIGAWRWHFLARCFVQEDGNVRSAIRLEMRITPVNVKTDAAGNLVKICGQRKDVDRRHGLVLRPGDFVAISLCNYSREDAYVSVLDLGTDGSIKLAYPLEEEGPVANVQPIRIKADGSWHEIRNVALRIDRPPGRELFKAIGTVRPADFSSLFFKPLSDDKSIAAGVPPEYQPLAALLRATREGT